LVAYEKSWVTQGRKKKLKKLIKKKKIKVDWVERYLSSGRHQDEPEKMDWRST